MEHAPGPRGSPHAPHAPTAGIALADAAEPFVWAANVESFRCRSWLWHSGQAGASLERTSASNSVLQLRQAYSYKGMRYILANCVRPSPASALY